MFIILKNLRETYFPGKVSRILYLTQQSQVYVGVDVFGRGCLGGGGFDTKVAVTKYSNDMFLNLISTLLTRPNSWAKQVREIEWGHLTLDSKTF